MALHRFLEMEVGVPDPAALEDFYREIGFTGGGGSWGAADQPGQIRIVEAPYRQLRRIRVGCEGEEDLAATARRLEGLGVTCQLGGGSLRCSDPENGWEVVVEPAEAYDVPEPPARVQNRPGARPRVGVRAEVAFEATPRPPRRLGHLVVGTPRPVETAKFFVEGIGYRISDTIGGGLGTFARCSPDHHNLLIAPGPVPYLNHYALEHDDHDAVLRAATIYLGDHEEAQIAGPGRHYIGGNVFWYMRDPSGTFFEFFADMDTILDDEAWVVRDDWPLDAWSVWGDVQQPEVFFRPDDIDEVIAGWNRAHG